MTPLGCPLGRRARLAAKDVEDVGCDTRMRDAITASPVRTVAWENQGRQPKELTPVSRERISVRVMGPPHHLF